MICVPITSASNVYRSLRLFYQPEEAAWLAYGELVSLSVTRSQNGDWFQFAEKCQITSVEMLWVANHCRPTPV